MRTLTALFVVALLAPYCLAEVELKGSPEELDKHLGKTSGRVVLNAEAKIEVEADKALIELAVVTKDRKLRTALAENQKVLANLRKHLASKGISKDSVKLSRYSSTPRPGLFTKTGSYDVRNTVTVSVDSESQFQIVAGFADDQKGVSYEGVSFEHNDRDQLELDVIKNACEKLSTKRIAYEKGLGVKLKLVRFAELPTALAVMQDQYTYPRASTGLSDSMIAADMQAEIESQKKLFSGMTFSCRIAGEFEVVSE